MSKEENDLSINNYIEQIKTYQNMVQEAEHFREDLFKLISVLERQNGQYRLDNDIRAVKLRDANRRIKELESEIEKIKKRKWWMIWD